MTEAVQITDHVDQGLEKLLSQYKDKPRLRAWIASYLKECQKLEDATWDVIIKRLIDYADDIQLETLGEIVGEKKKGRTAAIYRRFISARIRANRSRGRARDLLSILRLLAPGVAYSYRTVPHAAQHIDVEAPIDVNPYQVFDMLRDAKAGGVGLTVIVPSGATGFTFSSVGDTSDPTLGFSSVLDAPVTTGLLACAMR